jgi:hypothetical protein
MRWAVALKGRRPEFFVEDGVVAQNKNQAQARKPKPVRPLFFVVLKKILQGITVIELDLVRHHSLEGWRSRLGKLYQCQA